MHVAEEELAGLAVTVHRSELGRRQLVVPREQPLAEVLQGASWHRVDAPDGVRAIGEAVKLPLHRTLTGVDGTSLVELGHREGGPPNAGGRGRKRPATGAEQRGERDAG